MSFAGHVFDMISRLKDNRNLISSRHFNYKKQYRTHLELSKEKLKKITPEERLRIKALIIKQRKKQFVRKIISLFIALLITVALMYLLLFSEIKISSDFL